MADTQRSGQRIQDLEDRLESVTAEENARALRDRDARICRLEDELAAADRIVCAVRASLEGGGDVGRVVEDLRCGIMRLVEEQDRGILRLEDAVGLRGGRLEGYVALAMKDGIIEMRKGCAGEVQSLKMSVNELVALVEAVARCTHG